MKKYTALAGDIFYTVQGIGKPAFLLIHNAGGSHEMMAYTVAHYSKRGKTIVPDLLGHGDSSKPTVDYTLELFAKSLIELCQYEGVQTISIIGLNFGANVGIVMSQLAPGLISSLILIEPPICMEEWIVKLVQEQIVELQNPTPTFSEKLVDEVMPYSTIKNRELALKSMEKTPAFVKASVFMNLLEWDKTRTFQCQTPTLLIQTSHVFCTEDNARTVFSDLQVGRVVNSGPWATLEVPEQVHAMIDHFLHFS